MKKLIVFCAVLALSPVAALAANTTQITGAGSSFVYPLMARWATDYQNKTHAELNYQSIGSGGGLQQLKQNTINFAAVDMPQSSDTLSKMHWKQFPLVSGGIVVTVSLPGIPSNQLKLDGETLANIYLGKIKKWNDPAIQKLNPKLQLPSLTITPLHRADGSGTTFNFANYLSQVSPLWKSKVGTGTTLAWPTGIGAKGNSGVAMFAQHLPGSIGYVEYSYAAQNHLNTIKLKNHDGKFVAPTPNSFMAAAHHANWHAVKNFNLLLTNQPGAKSWPIDATTFVLVPQGKQFAKTNAQVNDFFKWCREHGSAAAVKLDYVPISAE